MALCAVDLSFRGEVWGRISGCRCSRRAVLARRRATTRVPISLWPLLLASASPGLHLCLSLSQKLEHLGTALPPSQCDLQSPLARVPRYESYGKISGRAYSGKRRGIFLSRNITSGSRGFGRPKFWKKLAFQQDFCYHCPCDKNWLRDEQHFKACHCHLHPNNTGRLKKYAKLASFEHDGADFVGGVGLRQEPTHG